MKHTPSARDFGLFRDEGVGMMQQVKRWYAVSLALIALCGSMTATAQSDAVLGISVTPGKFEAAMPPGSTYNVPITVTNTSVASTHILASLADFSLNLTGDYQFAKVGSQPYSILKWAAIRPREFDIPANTSQQVELSLRSSGRSKPQW